MKSTQLLRRRWTWLGAALASAAGLGWYLNQSTGSPPEFETATVSRSELTQLVTASGQLNPVVKVEVGSQISGIIQKLFVDFNSPVKEGQLIAQLDPATYEANLVQAQGNLASAVAAEELALLSANRAKALQAEKLNAKSEYEKAVADLHQAESAVKINEGTLKKAQVDLARCAIYAPIDGIVISRNVNVGQTVAASLSAPILFVIANDLSKMQIEADVAEADIGVVDVGQEVEFTVDAFPGRTFHGKVTQVRNAPKLELNVVTYVTVIDVNNSDLKLKPGMTANVSIIVARRSDALTIPGAALRFRLPKAADDRKPEAPALTDAKKKTDSAARKKEKRKAERTVYLASASKTAAGGESVGGPHPVQIKTGISDGRQIEVVEGLKEGDRVIIGTIKDEASRTRAVNPFTAGRRK